MSEELNGFVAPNEHDQGLELRDYFAAKVAASYYSNPTMFEAAGNVAKREGYTVDAWIALLSYVAADCMLKERAKK